MKLHILLASLFIVVITRSAQLVQNQTDRNNVTHDREEIGQVPSLESFALNSCCQGIAENQLVLDELKELRDVISNELQSKIVSKYILEHRPDFVEILKVISAHMWKGFGVWSPSLYEPLFAFDQFYVFAKITRSKTILSLDERDKEVYYSLPESLRIELERLYAGSKVSNMFIFIKPVVLEINEHRS